MYIIYDIVIYMYRVILIQLPKTDSNGLNLLSQAVLSGQFFGQDPVYHMYPNIVIMHIMKHPFTIPLISFSQTILVLGYEAFHRHISCLEPTTLPFQLQWTLVEKRLQLLIGCCCSSALSVPVEISTTVLIEFRDLATFFSQGIWIAKGPWVCTKMAFTLSH